MPPLDEKKELLNEFRRWQNYCVTTLIAIVAFIITQYDSIGMFLLWCSVTVVIILLVVIFYIARKIKRLIKEIGRL